MDSRLLVPVLMFVCLATKVSSQALLCNFDNAVENTETLPCTCDGMPCELSQRSSDNYNWLAWKGATPSTTTGPMDDHTLQNNQGLYIYAEASNQNPQNTAVIQTSTLSLGTMSCLRFWYHMNGQHMGKLTVTGVTASGASTILWEMDGNKGNNWLQAVVSLSDSVDKLTIKATRGGSAIGMPYGDIALDDIKIDRELCPGVTTTTRSSTITPTSTTTTTQTPSSLSTSRSTSTYKPSTDTQTTITTNTSEPNPTNITISTTKSTSTTTSTSSAPSASGQQELWGLDETLWIIILCVAGAVILVLLVIVCVQACAMRRMRTARIVRQSDDYSNIEAYNKAHPQNKDQRDNYINAYDNMAMDPEDKPTAHPNGGLM